MVADTFASPPYQVFQAENAEEALAIAKRERLDLLLIDLKLPGRNGTEVIKELRETYSLRQMVVITAFPDLMQMEELLNHGAITVFTKADFSRSAAHLCRGDSRGETALRIRMTEGKIPIGRVHRKPT